MIDFRDKVRHFVIIVRGSGQCNDDFSSASSLNPATIKRTTSSAFEVLYSFNWGWTSAVDEDPNAILGTNPVIQCTEMSMSNYGLATFVHVPAGRPLELVQYTLLCILLPLCYGMTAFDAISCPARSSVI
jgi:hypothetical protein